MGKHELVVRRSREVIMLRISLFRPCYEKGRNACIGDKESLLRFFVAFWQVEVSAEEPASEVQELQEEDEEPEAEPSEAHTRNSTDSS